MPPVNVNDDPTSPIAVIGPDGLDDFAWNVSDSLGALGYSVHRVVPRSFDALPGRISALATASKAYGPLGERMERHIVRSVIESGARRAITVISLQPDTVRELDRHGVRVALWFPDSVANLGSMLMFDAPYTALFFKEPALVRRMQAMTTLPIYFLPEACNPTIHRPVESGVDDGHVVVVGNLHSARARILERLVDDGIPLRIYGNPRQKHRHPSLEHLHSGSYVRGLDKSAVFRSASAVLNNLHPSEIDGMNCRLFEAAAAGGAVVTESRSTLNELFSAGEEVLAFEDYDEMLGQLRSLIGDPDRRRALGNAASARAHTDHSYSVRLEQLLECLG